MNTPNKENNMDTKLTIAFGRRTFPDDVQAVWGARLIWPADLLHDRQDLAAHSAEAKQELIAWLNGPNRGDGALRKTLDALKDPYQFFTGNNDDTCALIYSDEQGEIIGSPQGSFGYVYIAAWLHKHTEQ